MTTLMTNPSSSFNTGSGSSPSSNNRMRFPSPTLVLQQPFSKLDSCCSQSYPGYQLPSIITHQHECLLHDLGMRRSIAKDERYLTPGTQPSWPLPPPQPPLPSLPPQQQQQQQQHETKRPFANSHLPVSENYPLTNEVPPLFTASSQVPYNQQESHFSNFQSYIPSHHERVPSAYHPAVPHFKDPNSIQNVQPRSLSHAHMHTHAQTQTDTRQMPPFVSPQLTSYEQQPRDSQTNEQLLSQNGDGDWSSVYPPLRKKPKQSTNWTSAEDKLLLELKEVRKLGWREISTFFHDRTPNACQFRWRRMISAVSPVLATANTKVAIARNDNREAELGAEESSSTSLSSSSRNVDPHAESQPPNDDDSESSKSVLDEDEPVYKMRRNVHSIEYLLN